METLETLEAAEAKPSSAQTLETPVEERVIVSFGPSEARTELGLQSDTPVTGIKDNGVTNGDSGLMVEDSVVKMRDGSGCELMESDKPVEEVVTVSDENTNNGVGVDVVVNGSSPPMVGDVVVETQPVESDVVVATQTLEIDLVVETQIVESDISEEVVSVTEGVDGEDGTIKDGVNGGNGGCRSDGPDDGALGRQTDEMLATAFPEGKEEDGEEDVEEMNYKENKFSVGDFVWGKIKSHPWWPGHVYYPSDASGYAEKYHREGRLLVAYFGDRTFAWCNPSQLRPFLDDFEQMSKQSNSKTFINAVENALDEFGRCLELEMACACVKIEPSVAVNAGIKEGVSVPKGGVSEVFSINGFEPINFLTGLRDTAQDVFMSSLLELTVFRSRLSAFFCASGYGQLPMYHQHEGIMDPEDNAEIKLSDGEINESPTKEDWLSSPTGPWTHKTSLRPYQRVPSFSQEKLYQRKKRSMAELMAEDADSERANEDSTIENGSDAVEETKVDRKSALSSRKHRKTKRSESPSEIAKNKTPEKENDEDGAKEETVSSPRIRKKSKYLSPPYTMLGLQRSFSSKDAEKETPKSTNDSRDREYISFKDTETEVPKGGKVSRVGERISRIAGQLTGSHPMMKCNSETSQEARAGRNTSDSLSPRTPKANQRNLVLDEDGASADEMLSKFRSAALDTSYLKKKRRSSDVTVGFFTRFRSSLYREGSDFETYKKYLTDSNGKKRKKPSDAKNRSAVPIDLKHGSLIKCSHDTNSSEGKPGRKKLKSKEETSGKNSHETDLSKGKPGRKKKSKEETTGKNSHEIDPSEGKPGWKKQKSKEETSGKNSHETDLSEGKPGWKKQKSKEETLGKNSHETDPSEGKPGLKKRKSMEETLGKNSTDTDPSEGKPGRKKQNKEEALVKDSYQTVSSEGKPVQKRRKRKEEARDANRKEAKGDKTLTALLLTFAPGFALPSKADLVKVFSRFGVVNEPETEVLKSSGCAQIVFQKTSDAEKAFNNSDKIVDFGSGIVSYRLRFPSGGSRALESNGNVRPVDKEPPPSSSQVAADGPLLFIQKNLETMASMLIKSPDKLSPDERANLEGEIRGLLKKVNKIVESST